MSLESAAARKPHDAGNVPEKQRKPRRPPGTTRELVVNSKGINARGDAEPVLFALLIRHGSQVLMALVTLKMVAIAAATATAAATSVTGGPAAAVVGQFLKIVLKLAGNMALK